MEETGWPGRNSRKLQKPVCATANPSYFNLNSTNDSKNDSKA